MRFAAAPVQAFVRSRKGSVGMIFSLTALPAIALVIVAVDYSASIAEKGRVQMALDSAVLAAANSSSPSTTSDQRVTTATKMFNSAIGRDAPTVTNVQFTVDDGTNQINGTVTTSRRSVLNGQLYTANYKSSAIPTATLVRALDVALCVDATGSMQNTLNAVQNNVANFKTALDTAISSAGYRPFDQTRVRVIYYRDFGGNGVYNLWGWHLTGAALGDDPALVASDFYNMGTSSDVSAFQSYVYTQSAWGGGDLPESGLECLYKAMNSSWAHVGDTLSGGKKVTDVFPVISIYTDAGAHPPNFTYSVQNPNYPADMPRNYTDLLAAWNNSSVIDQSHKSILFYGNPDVDDDYYFGNVSGWKTVKTWGGFQNPASLTSANNNFIASLAKGIVGTGQLRLTH